MTTSKTIQIPNILKQVTFKRSATAFLVVAALFASVAAYNFSVDPASRIGVGVYDPVKLQEALQVHVNSSYSLLAKQYTMFVCQVGSNYVLARGNDSVLLTPWSTNKTYIEYQAIQNCSSGGSVGLKEVAHNYSLTIPLNVGVIEDINGTVRRFYDSNTSSATGGYTVSTDETYYFVQDSYGVYLDDFTSTNASEIFENIQSGITANIGVHIKVLEGSYGNSSIPCNIILKRNVVIEGAVKRTSIIYGSVSFDSLLYPITTAPSKISYLTIAGKTVGSNYGMDWTGNAQGVTVSDVRVSGVLADNFLNGSDMFKCTWDNVNTDSGGLCGWNVTGFLDNSLIVNCFSGNQNYSFYASETSILSNSKIESFTTASPDVQGMVWKGTFSGMELIDCTLGDLHSLSNTNVVEFNSSRQILINPAGTNIFSQGNVIRDSRILASQTTNGNILFANCSFSIKDCIITGNLTFNSDANVTVDGVSDLQQGLTYNDNSAYTVYSAEERNTQISAYITAATQSLPANTTTQITFNAENFDNLNEFDTATYNFTASHSGKYKISFSLIYSVLANNQQVRAEIYKNTIAIRSYPSGYTTTAFSMSQIVVVILDLNKGDAVSFWVFNGDTSNANTASGTSSLTRLEIERVR